MKVYQCPAEVEWQKQDLMNYDWKREEKLQRDHQDKLREWLKKAGYTGQYTGDVIYFPVADGRAMYMVGDKGRSMILIHLPYGDYEYHGVQHFPRSAIIEQIKRHRAVAELFSKKK